MAGGGQHAKRRGVGMRGRRDDHCSGRYTSYWNAFLLLLLIKLKTREVDKFHYGE